jgi:hypothetical protein
MQDKDLTCNQRLELPDGVCLLLHDNLLLLQLFLQLLLLPWLLHR